MRCIFRGEMGVIDRLAVCHGHARFAVVAALIGMCASLVSCPSEQRQVRIQRRRQDQRRRHRCPGPIRDLVADGERKFQEDDLEPCGLPGVPLASSTPSLALSQITPPQSVYLSLLSLAQQPLRC